MDEKKSKQYLPFSSVLAVVLLVIVLFLFASGELYKFYASVVFFFYSITHTMWVSVILLGVFQTVILIPFRIFRLLDFKNIRDFQSETADIGDKAKQQDFLKSQFRQGSWTFTLYLLDFVVQLTTYMTIGRLFLTDFYSKRLNPNVLYSFVQYPDYPIQERFFRIPYPSVTKTLDFGFDAVIYMWLIILIAELAIAVVRGAKRTKTREGMGEAILQSSKSKLSGKYLIAYGVILYTVSYILMRNFPIGWKLRIFSGDVAFQNNTFNTVTALATFFTLLYFGVNDILRKGKIASEMGIPDRVVDTTQIKLFRDSFFNAALIGAGAYFITNQIPCAFELSIFTLEVISLFSPLTLDRWILKAAPKKMDLGTDKEVREKEEVKTQFSGKIEG